MTYIMTNIDTQETDYSVYIGHKTQNEDKEKKIQCRKFKRRKIYEPQQNLRVNTGDKGKTNIRSRETIRFHLRN